MSPGGMAVLAPVSAQPGERVIAYVDHLGRLEGHVARLFENGFAMTISATTRKRDKLAAQLTWLANRHILGLPEDRRHGRIVPRKPIARLILPNGINVSCRIIDISQSGAGLATDQRPPLGSLVTLGTGAGPRSASPRGWFCDRVHPIAAPGFSRRRDQRPLTALRPRVYRLPLVADGSPSATVRTSGAAAFRRGIVTADVSAARYEACHARGRARARLRRGCTHAATRTASFTFPSARRSASATSSSLRSGKPAQNVFAAAGEFGVGGPHIDHEPLVHAAEPDHHQRRQQIERDALRGTGLHPGRAGDRLRPGVEPNRAVRFL